MKQLSDLLQLGNPLLYEVCEPVLQSELPLVNEWVADLHNVMEEIRVKYNFGRAIAAPQLGIMKRLIYMNIDKPIVFINPEFSYLSNEMFEIWDDCMSFPNLLVKCPIISISYSHSSKNPFFSSEYLNSLAKDSPRKFALFLLISKVL